MSTCTYTERQRSKRIDWIDVSDTPRLTGDAELRLFARIDQGDVEARDYAVRANLPLVVSIAKQFRGRGVPFEDLVGSGSLGLIRAVECYEPYGGARFSTFAAHWIKQSIYIGISVHRNAPFVPHFARVLANKWLRTERELSESLEREPTREEIAKALGLTRKRAAIALQAIETGNFNSLAEGRSDEHDASTGEGVPDLRSQAVQDAIVNADEAARLVEHLSELTEREATVIRMRFGIGHSAPMTLREVGETLGLTRERIRQIEAGALAKLRAAMADETEGEW